MRIVLFYSEEEAFNYFTDQLVKEFTARGHETFVLDLPAIDPQRPESYAEFAAFLSEKVDAVVCFDGLGAREDMFIEAWDRQDAVVVDILLDPPLRFHATWEKHPRNYLLLCCDHNHAAYVKKYFGGQVPQVGFMPHAGVQPGPEEEAVPWGKKKYDILFSGTYYRPGEQFARITEHFPSGTPMYRFYEAVYQLLKRNSGLTVEQAVEELLAQLGEELPEEQKKTILLCSGSVDWAIRMDQRERVVQTLAEAGFELYLLGRGWENHPSAGEANVHRIDGRIPFEKTLDYMSEAKICLNVMPWFKAGSHERIFNALLRHSLPLTDSSSWISEHFTDGEDIALYDLNFLEQLPFITDRLLADEDRTTSMIRRGYEKAAEMYTWANCADRVLEAVLRREV